MYQLKHIAVLILTILCCAGLQAQVHIGDGVTISEGSTMVISNQDVIIKTDEIKGEGDLIINNENDQLLSVQSEFKSANQITVNAPNVEVEGDYATHFTAMYLPQLSNEVKLAAESERQKKIQKELPVRYINVEGLVYDTQEEEKQPNDPIFKSLPVDHTDGVVMSEVLQIHAIDFKTDYLIPIYSTLNDARFSDDAKLYEFESLTAILKPPIV